MSHPIVTTITTIAGNAALLAASQSVGVGGGALVLTGATLDAPRRIGITSGGNDSGIKFTVTGTARPEQGGVVLVETIAGSNGGVAQTTQDFATVTSITASAATASTVTAGTTAVASGPWVVWSSFASQFQVAVQGNVLSGSPTYSLEFTQDDPFGLWLPSGVTWPRPSTFGGMAALTQSGNTQITAPVRASRLTLTAVGGVRLTQQQQGT